MANSKSALKRVRQSETRTAHNKTLTTRMKTLRKKALAEAEVEYEDKTSPAIDVGFEVTSDAADQLCPGPEDYRSRRPTRGLQREVEYLLDHRALPECRRPVPGDGGGGGSVQ